MRPPIKAFKSVVNYCKKNTTCKGCPLHVVSDFGLNQKNVECRCDKELPELWDKYLKGEEE